MFSSSMVLGNAHQSCMVTRADTCIHAHTSKKPRIIQLLEITRMDTKLRQKNE